MRTESSTFGLSTRTRVLVIIGVIALSLWMIYPVQTSLKPGLDLNGGPQLVLRVKTEEALLLQTQAAAEQLRTTLTDARVSFSAVEVVNATEFRAHGIGDESALRRAADESASIYVRTSAVARRPRPRPAVHALVLPPGWRQRVDLGRVEPAHCWRSWPTFR